MVKNESYIVQVSPAVSKVKENCKFTNIRKKNENDVVENVNWDHFVSLP